VHAILVARWKIPGRALPGSWQDAGVLAARPSTTPSTALRFSGDFEIHLTVAPGQGPALADWAPRHGLKFVEIELARGATPGQPMLTLTTSGTLAGAAAAARRIAEQTRSARFEVVRVKIEAAPWNEGVPESDAEARLLGPRYYFEHHIKLVLPDDLGRDELSLAEVVERHGAHLSRNARRTRPDGLRERFVTQRCRLVGARTAGHRLDALLAALATRDIVTVEREFVVLDSAESLDAGWIDETIDEERTRP